MGNYKDRKRSIKVKKKEKKMGKYSRVCPFCKKEMRCRGAFDSAGSISWKCRRKSCGRTIKERYIVKPPIPLTPKIRVIGGYK